MKGLIALVVVLSLGYVGVRQLERAQSIVLEVPESYAAAQTVQLSSQRDLFAELEMKLPPGLGDAEEVSEGAVPVAPEVAVAPRAKSYAAAGLKKRSKRGYHSRSRRHKRSRR